MQTMRANLFYAYVFDSGQMTHDYRASGSDRMLTARSMSVAKRHAPWPEPTQDETNAAVPELREVAGDRPDLLAEVAGNLLGASEGRLDEPRSKAAASFCIAAGADQSSIPGWIEEGRRRVAISRKPPSSDPAPRPPWRG
jgi:hypothetical protein